MAYQHKSIPPRERLIVALDVPTPEAALGLVGELGDAVVFYKIGLELFMTGGYFELVEQLAARDKKIFCDLKFFDIPNTVASAVRQFNELPVQFCTVHGNDGMMAAAAEAADSVQVLAVTALTSLDRGDLDDLGFQCDVEALVLSRARRALAVGCAGVVSSGLEVPRLRAEVDHALVTVCPGIRPVLNQDDDQKRAVDV
ncbi:MAG: orotidine-5'-phosphate decarboxylase, partial [Xanthomonadales bacterium]|nr:orotidine-5'-phosphate decarboxylase [Xanthomonadales bacterium]